MNYNTIVNLTRSTFHVRDIAGNVHEIPPSGRTAWVKSTSEDRGFVTVGDITFRLTEPYEDHIIGLPEPIPGVLFVATSIVAEFASRPDVVSPGQILTDDKGLRVGHSFCIFEDGGVA